MAIENDIQQGPQAFDVIVVGAGSAGCLLSHRLATSPHFLSKSILILEAGKDRRGDPKIDTPASPSTLQGDPEYDWCFVTEPEVGLDGRQIKHPRGKVVGGTSAINSHSLVFPSRFYHDFWAHSLVESQGLHTKSNKPEDHDAQSQSPRRAVDWSWNGVESYYTRAFNMQPPSKDVQEKLGAHYEAIPVESILTARDKEQSGKIQASFPATASTLQESWVETFKRAGLFSQSAGFDGRAFGSVTATNAVDGTPTAGARSHAGRECWPTLTDCPNIP